MMIVGDATQESHGRDAVKQIINTRGDIDIAILNVGIGPPSNTLTITPEKVKFCYEANYYSFINFFCPLIERMKHQPRPCMISHMNSQATWFGIPMQGDYTAAKAAARYVLKGLKKEMRENIFPPATKWATKLGKIVPHQMLTKILLAATPKHY